MVSAMHNPFRKNRLRGLAIAMGAAAAIGFIVAATTFGQSPPVPDPAAGTVVERSDASSPFEITITEISAPATLTTASALCAVVTGGSACTTADSKEPMIMMGVDSDGVRVVLLDPTRRMARVQIFDGTHQLELTGMAGKLATGAALSGVPDRILVFDSTGQVLGTWDDAAYNEVKINELRTQNDLEQQH